MKNINLKKSLVALITAALVAALGVVIPTTARAAGPDCSGTALPKYPVKNYDVQLCEGTDQYGAKYEIAMPKKFNGTLLVWSHGIRKNSNLPPIPVVAPKGYIVDNSAEIAPTPEIAAALLNQGFALAGSGVRVQGWNLREQVHAAIIVIDQARATFPEIDRIAAWGASLGGLSSQILAETYPGLVDAVAPVCLSDSALSEITMAGDFLWGVKTLFDPTIKAVNYSPGAAGYVEMVTDIGKVLTVFGTISATIKANPLTPAWPATSTAPATLTGPIPVRSAVLLLGLISGISTQSTTFDSSSGPAGPLETSFGLAISPALAVLENGAQAAILAVVANYDMELRAGGVVFDNSKTNYAARLGDDGDVYAAGLSGKTATAGMLGYLSALNPAAPRVTANASAVASMKALGEISGKITVPTITLTATADHITPPGATQYLVNQYNSAITNGESKKGLLVNIWNKPADEYTKFVNGAPVTPSPVTNGTEHCNFTDSQFMMIAKMLTDSAKSGKAPSAKTVATAIRKDKNLFVDPNYTAPLLKYRQ